MFNYLYMYSKKILDTFLRQNTPKIIMVQLKNIESNSVLLPQRHHWQFCFLINNKSMQVHYFNLFLSQLVKILGMYRSKVVL